MVKGLIVTGPRTGGVGITLVTGTNWATTASGTTVLPPRAVTTAFAFSLALALVAAAAPSPSVPVRIMGAPDSAARDEATRESTK